MILDYIFLSCIHKLNNNKYIIFLGNFISFLLSNKITSGDWGGYFKPFCPSDFVVFITILSILLQLF